MNYHIMIDDKFINDFIIESEKVSHKYDNRYLIRGVKGEFNYVNHPKAEWINNVNGKDFLNILQGITVKDKIVVHWYNLSIGKLILNLDKNIPLYVVFWGGEFYEDPFFYHIRWIYDKETIKYVIKHLFLKRFLTINPITLLKRTWWILNLKKSIKKSFELKKETVRRIDYLLLDKKIFFADYLKIKSIYGIDKIKSLPFIYNLNFDTAKTIVQKPRQITTIMVGNSATPSNNHVDCINILKRYDKENIKLLLPISYGDLNYAKYVKKEYLRNFSCKCEFIENFLPRNEYISKLNQVDIAIIYSNRSQAFGNCIALLTMGKKLFLKKINPFWVLFRSLGVFVYSIEEIVNMDFDEFVRPLNVQEVNKNIAVLSKLFSEKKRLEYLENILNS